MSDSIVCHNNVSVSSCIGNANKARFYIDTFSKPDKYSVKHYLRHLQDCYDCPTLGFLAKKEYYNTNGVAYPSKFVRNKHLIEYEDEVVDMKLKIKKRISELYPRTKYIREYITNSRRINLYMVRLLGKYTYWDKFIIASRKFIKGLIL